MRGRMFPANTCFLMFSLCALMYVCTLFVFICIYACAAIGRSAFTHKRARTYLYNLHKHNPLFEHLYFRQHIFMYVWHGREDKSPTQKVVRLQAQAVVALGTCTFPIVEEVSNFRIVYNNCSSDTNFEKSRVHVHIDICGKYIYIYI